MKINKVNLGEVIRQKVDESGISKAKFAESLNIARQNIDKTIFSKHSLDTDLLCNVCEVLNCNLFDYYRSDIECNTKDYITKEEIKATLSIEMGKKKQDKVFRFIFGENDIRIE
ncbi:MAG: hypothetical protein RRY36_09840 [Bacteroidaceae bacterium]